MMKIGRYYLLTCLALLLLGNPVKSQGLLGIGITGFNGLPANVQYGDTIQNWGLWLVNRGVVPIAGVTVNFLAAPNYMLNSFTIGSLDLTAGVLQPGDSTYVPLDYFVVSPQNSNQGANVMVIWPTAPGAQPGDTAVGDYNVDGPNALEDQAQSLSQLTVWPNPCTELLHVQSTKGTILGLELWDLAGHTLLHSASTDLSVQGLAAGTYLLRIQGTTGVSTQKLVIQ